MNRFEWTDERIEKLKLLWAEGLSSRDIACRLGNDSRSSVIGKLHRLGLSDVMRGKPKPVPVPRIARPRSVPSYRKPIVVPTVMPAATPSQTIEDVQQSAIDEDRDIPVGERKTLLELERGDCRWPIGHPNHAGFGFCGRGAALGLPYCDAHARRAYRTMEPHRADIATSGIANDNQPAAQPRVVPRETVDA